MRRLVFDQNSPVHPPLQNPGGVPGAWQSSRSSSSRTVLPLFNIGYLKHDYFDKFSSFKFVSVPLSSSLFSERYKPTTRGVHQPSFQGQLITFHFWILNLSPQQETKKKRQYDCNEKDKTPHYVMAGKTLKSFLRDGLSKCWWLGRHLTSSF